MLSFDLTYHMLIKPERADPASGTRCTYPLYIIDRALTRTGSSKVTICPAVSIHKFKIVYVMEEKQKVGDITEVLTCTICLEIFKNPKYLPCLHTFCDTCLVTYITFWIEKGKGSKIECPVCRIEVKAPSENCTAENWTKKLPENFLLAGLVENKKITRAEKLCMLCDRSGSKSIPKATVICLQCTDALCDTCGKNHNFNKASKDHDIKPIGRFSEELLFPAFRNSCEIHRDETLKLYCVDHKVPCCCVCVSIKHRKCDEVTSLEDAAKGIKNSSVIAKIRRGLFEAGEFMDNCIKSYQDSMVEIETQYSEYLKTIESNFSKMKETLDKQEFLRKSQLEKIYTEIKNRRETAFNIMENKNGAIQQEKRLLEACLGKASEMQVMIETSKFEKSLKTYQDEKDNMVELLSSISDNITLKHFNISNFQEQIQHALEVSLHSPQSKKLTFNRFSTLKRCNWIVRSMADAISFSVSSPIELLGVLCFSCKNMTGECSVQVTIQQKGQILSRLSADLSTNPENYINNVTELFLEQPLKILQGAVYEVVFLMKSDSMCESGRNGRSKVDCDGVVFNFTDSSISKNSTSTSSGQIPGFIFRKLNR